MGHLLWFITNRLSKRAASVHAEGPLYRLDFERHRYRALPLQTLQAQKWHINGSGTFGSVWFECSFQRLVESDCWDPLRDASAQNQTAGFSQPQLSPSPKGGSRKGDPKVTVFAYEFRLISSD